MIVPRRLVTTGLLVLCAIAALKSAWDLWTVLALEWNGAIESDSLLYFTVGRGIVNGLTPWTDLYESKPPGMFLIAAASLLLSGNETFALILQLLIFITLPVLLGWFAWNVRREDALHRWTVALLGAVVGMQVMLLLEERAGGIQTESFGVWTSAVYAFLLLRWDELSWKRVAVLAVLLLATIGLKEPFVLPLFAVALLTAEHPRRLLWSFAVPLGIAAAAGLLLLVLFGWFPAYVSDYLPAMLQSKINASSVEPLWVRGFSAGRVFGNLTQFYTAPLLGYVLAACWLVAPATMLRREATAREIGITVAATLTGYFVLIETFLYAVTWNVWRMGAELESGLPFLFAGPVYAGLLLLLGGLLLYQYRQERLWSALVSLCALYVCAAVVGISVYAVNHFAFAIPVYLAVLFLFLRSAGTRDHPLWVTAIVALLAVTTALAYRPSKEHFKRLEERTVYASWNHEDEMERLDGMLQACGVDRYGSLGAFFSLSFARHSPIGPLFVMQFHEYLGPGHPLFVRTEENLRQASIIVSAGSADAEKAKPLLDSLFTTDAPLCAQPFLPLGNLTTYFRKGA